MLDDLRSAWRRLRHAPGFTAAATITLALAIGANTAILSIADGVLFRPLPYKDPDRVHILQRFHPTTGRRTVLIEYRYLKEVSARLDSLGEVALLGRADAQIIEGPDGAESLAAIAVTPNYFDVLGTTPARGRLLRASDETSIGRPAVLSYAAWRQRFGGDETIVGRPARIGAATFDIVGILPQGFVFPTLFAGSPALVTLMPPLERQTQGGTFHPIVRRAPNVSRAHAQAELDALMMSIPPDKPGDLVTLVLDDVRSVLQPTGRPIMIFLLASAVFVLLIGCVNLSGMVHGRTLQRQKETAVRLALGASRLRLIRPLVFETLIVSVAGAVLALLVTTLGFDALLRQVPPVAYRGAPVGVDLRVVVFALGLGLAAGLLFSVVPAWRTVNQDVRALVQPPSGQSHRRQRFGRPLLIVQVALAVVLVAGAIVASRAFLSVLRVPLGFSPDAVVTLRVLPRGVAGIQLQDFYVRAIESLSNRSDVAAAGSVGSMPLDNGAFNEPISVGGTRTRLAGILHVLPGYFETIGIPLQRGRTIDSEDVRSGADVAILSEGAARVLFPNADAIGGTVSNDRGRRYTVVGIVANVRKSLDADWEHPVYVIPREGTRSMTLVIRTRSANDAALAAIKRDVGALAPGTPVGAVWWSDTISGITAYRNPRFQTVVLGSFAGLALLLTATGIFGIVAFVVAARTKEMGIRIAIGAKPRSLVAMIVRQTLIPVAIGIAGGLVAARWMSRLAEAQLFKVDARDPIMLTAAAATVIATALAAAYLPARRASCVDPVDVLRAE